MPLTYQPFAQASELDQVRKTLAINVETPERVLSVLGGVALALFGGARRGFGGAVLLVSGAALVYRGVTGHCQLYDALAVNSPAGEAGVRGNKGIKISKSVKIAKPRADVYRYWRTLENLPNFMTHLRRVEVIDQTRSRWVVRGPAGSSVEWHAEIINERENELLAWQSLPGAEVQNAGSVRFEDAPEGGTLVTVTLEFQPPAGMLGAAVARLFGEAPDQQLDQDLARFREILEGSKAASSSA